MFQNRIETEGVEILILDVDVTFGAFDGIEIGSPDGELAVIGPGIALSRFGLDAIIAQQLHRMRALDRDGYVHKI